MIEDLLEDLFPELIINHSSRMGDGYFSVPYEDNWLHFPADSISDREKKLIVQLTTPEVVHFKKQTNRWARFLLEQSSDIPTNANKVQLLQVSIKHADDDSFDYQLWLDAFKNTLSFVKDGFFITETYGVLVIDNPSHIDLLEEIEGILNVLDDDFTVQTTVYLGQNWPVDNQLPALFAEEQQIFMNRRSHYQHKKIATLAEHAITYFTYEAASKSTILHHLKEAIFAIDGGNELVMAMWQNLGNISKAANDLYVHRNTLQYRIERFFQETGVNLKTMDDLLLSYLAIHARFEK